MKAAGMLAGLFLVLSTGLMAQAQEVEPNDDPATATPATRGSSAQATIGPFNSSTFYRDFDYWKLTANAGDTIFVDVDADEFGSKMNMSLVLYAADGTSMVASNSDWDGMDPHLEYAVTTTGTYYVVAGTTLETTPHETAKPYTIHFFQVKCPTAGDHEPNNTPQTANSATVGTDIRGGNCPSGDVDVFKYTLDPGTYEFVFVMDPHERPTFGSAGEIAGMIQLYGADGTTELARTDGEGVPDRIEQTVRTRGTYFVRTSIWPGGIRYTYTLSSKKMSGPAPADPITERAELAAGYWGDGGAAVDRNGDILASNPATGVWRISPQGAKTKVAGAVEFPVGLAWDADNNLLIVSSAGVYANSSTDGGVYKLAPNGAVTRVITDDRVDGAIAMSPDGSMWLTSYSAKLLLHYDGQGSLLEAYNVADVSGSDGPRHVALGTSGDPYFSTWTDVYRFRNGTAEPVIHYDRTRDATMAAFAFDAQGNFYIPNAVAGVVNLHDATGKWLETISYEPNAPSRVMFGRNADGSMNRRLFAIDQNKLIEFNSAGVRAPGLPVQFDRQQEPTTAQAITDLLHGGALTDAQRKLLDQRGNNNGRYDVGDLRALLIRSGTLSTTVTRN